jgi:RNA polymerase sigma-70 factor (ECF subfamily)
MPSANNQEIRSDADLLKAALAGDEGAFVSLYQKLKDGIFRYAFYMTNSVAAAEEVTQDVFVALLKEGSNYREERGDVGAFVFGISRNFVRRLRRRERIYYSLPDDDAIQRLAAGLATDPEALQLNLIRNQAQERVRTAVRSLPDRYAQVIVLCDLCEFSYAEAAARLDCAVGTVRSRLNRAHALLAKKLKAPKRSGAEIGAQGTEGCVI